MSDNKQEVDFSGKLSVGVDPTKVKQGDYTDALNVQFLTNDTESTKSHIPMLGNTAAFDLGSVAVQNKTWRIYTPQDAVNASGGIFLYDQNGNLFPTIAGQIQPMVWNRNQTLANQATAIAAMFVTIDGPGNTVVTAGSDYIDITTDTINGYDIGLAATTKTAGTPSVTDTALECEVMAEAYDVCQTGELNDIASNDLLGDLMLLSTPQAHLPEILTYTFNGASSTNAITNVVVTSSHYVFTTAQPHGLSTGMKIITSEIVYTGTPVQPPNGIWIITVLTSLTFRAEEWYTVTTGYTAWVSGGIITLYIQGVGEIGVAQKDINTDVWTYTRLLRTNKWNFRTKKQPDFRVSERTTLKDSHYWTNDYGPPIAFYYDRPLNGVFVNAVWNGTVGDLDGAIEQINPNGHYSYLSVYEEAKLLLNAGNTNIQFIQQFQAGGQIECGNWRYAYHFLPDSLVATDDSDLTNPVNVYTSADDGNPVLITGDAPATVTSKINELQITGIIPGLFKYVELIGINYVGGAIEGWLIKRVLLDGISTSVIIQHTGTETGITSYDLGLLNRKNIAIETARNMDSVDKRMVLSNVTLAQQKDFTAWAQTITYALARQQLPAVRSTIQGTLVSGEYQLPANVNHYMSYMHNETYRFSAKVRMRKNGFWTNGFWVDDITINCDPTSPSGRRIFGLADFNLTANSSGGADDILFSAYVGFQINNALLDYLIDGIKVRDLIDAISFERAEVVPTILACGVGILGVSGTNNAGNAGGWMDGYDAAGLPVTYSINASPDYTAPDLTRIIEFPFASGRVAATFPLAPNPLYPGVASDDFDARRYVASFYSPDILFNHTSISFSSADSIINFGNPEWNLFDNPINSDNMRADSSYAEYNGRTYKDFANPPTTVPLVGSFSVLKGGSIAVSGARTFYKLNQVMAPGPIVTTSDNPSSLVLDIGSGNSFVNPAGSTVTDDYGIYYMQYYRALSDQYGNKNLTKYVSCGHFLEVTPSSGNSLEAVFGGDTFTQASYFKHRESDSGLAGLGGGLFFYSQNRINSQMKFRTAGVPGSGLFPSIPITDWIQTHTADIEGFYQEGYTIRNQVKSDIAFDSNVDQFTDLPVSIFWSDIKIEDSPIDGYRMILPLNRHDLDNVDGEIVHHGKSNSELITWQPRAFQRQYFNTRGTLQVQNITQILIGDGSVMSRDGVTMSRFGSLNKWSVIHGISANGDDVYVWINTEMKNVAHYASDGTLTISDEWMKSFFANNLTWVEGKDIPADGTGICGVYDQRFNNFIFTVKGRRQTIYAWDSSVNYTTVGQLVYYEPATFSTFGKTGELFLNKFNGNTNHIPVAIYPIPNVISTLTGTTTLTITTASPHLLVTGDQVKFRNISGLSSDINEAFYAITRTGSSTFTVSVSALTNNYVANSGSIVEVNPKYWAFIPHTDNNYYNEYSVVFNGFKVGFITFASFLPRIYNKWKNTFLSPRPISPVYKIYLHNMGIECTWYDYSGVVQEQMGYIEAVINLYPQQTKWFTALGIDSEIVPDSMNFTTKNHISYFEESDFEYYEDSYFSVIKEDSTVTVSNPLGLNDQNTSLLWGKYLKAKFNFAVGVYQKLSNFVVNFDVSDMMK